MNQINRPKIVDMQVAYDLGISLYQIIRDILKPSYTITPDMYYYDDEELLDGE